MALIEKDLTIENDKDILRKHFDLFMLERQQEAFNNKFINNPEYRKLNDDCKNIWEVIKQQLGSSFLAELETAVFGKQAIIEDAIYLQGFKDGMNFKQALEIN